MPVFALLLSSALIAGALLFQYMGYAPCQMCYWQRYAHWAVIGLSLLFLILLKAGIGKAKLFALLLGLALLGSVYMGVWHAGVEYGFWEGPASCLGGGGDVGPIPTDPAEFEKWLNAAKPPACSNSPWPNSPISMAGLNALISLFGALVCFRFAGKEPSNV